MCILICVLHFCFINCMHIIVTCLCIFIKAHAWFSNSHTCLNKEAWGRCEQQSHWTMEDLTHLTHLVNSTVKWVYVLATIFVISPSIQKQRGFGVFCFKKWKKKEKKNFYSLVRCVCGRSNILDPELLSNWSELWEISRHVTKKRADKATTTSNFTMERQLQGLILVLVIRYYTVCTLHVCLQLLVQACCCLDR